MKILVTGAKGFIGKNLIAELKNQNYIDIFEYDIDSTLEELNQFTKDCEFVFHLAGVNRPKDPKEFQEGNFGFTTILLDYLKKNNNKAPIMLASSIQAELDNPYGVSKKDGEELLFSYGKENETKVLIYRFPNVFGKWCRPNYNSVIATFSHNIANDIPITVNDENVEMNLVYIDDLVKELINALRGEENRKDRFCFVEPDYKIRLSEVINLLYLFKKYRESNFIPRTDDPFIKKLYATYISYINLENILYDLIQISDDRGSFTELLKSQYNGQISLNISKKGIIKGNHWHHTKIEKFIVLSGQCIVRIRHLHQTNIVEYKLSNSKLQVLEIPPGYIHQVENIGESDLMFLIWSNEVYNKNNDDTYMTEV
jgi:UDP-2-acetamido-2,6-beta-L-arabino-hexul-4-ose reductase